MLYALSQSEVAQFRSIPFVAEFTGAEMLIAVYRTDPAVVAQILPKPLTAPRDPIVIAFVARYPQTNFGLVYNEGALLVQAVRGRETGTYCLSMPVDDDMAMVYGREQYGYPKKIAESITLEHTGSQVVGSVRRKGTEILRIELEPKAPAEAADLAFFGTPAVDQDGKACLQAILFLFKFFLTPDGKGFDYFPRLVREPVLFRPRPGVQKGEGRVVVQSSPWDPLGDIPVRSMVTCFHGAWDNTMLPGRVVSRVWNPLRFLPHAFFKIDLVPFGLGWTGTDQPGAEHQSTDRT